MREKVNFAANVAVIVLVGVFLLRPGGPLPNAWRSWKAARADGALAAKHWEPLISGIRTYGPLGDVPEAPVRVVEFIDYQCPYCKRMHELTNQRQLLQGVRVAVRHLPLRGIHPNAELAARISICSEPIAASWPQVHGLLFQIADSIQGIAWAPLMYRIGVEDTAAVSSCISAENTNRRLAEDERYAAVLGLHGTPSYVFPDGIHRGAVEEDDLRRRLR
jgi:protein-disulfide isomerase